MKARSFLGAIVLIWIIGVAPGICETPADAMPGSSELDHSLHAFMDSAAGSRGYVGGVALVMRRGQVIGSSASGYRDFSRREPMTEDAIFRIYSMTKPVTSVALMLLVEEGRVDLEDRLQDYLPAFAQINVLEMGAAGVSALRPAKSPITLRELLTHTAGFPAGLPGDGAAADRQRSVNPHGADDLRGFTDRLANAPLAADPATRFGYDGAATEVVARVIEVVSGQTFPDFLQTRIFDPLKMPDTGFSVPESKRRRVVDITTMDDSGHLRIADGLSAVSPGEPLRPYASGAGGLYSSASDYARFAQMLLSGGAVDGKTLMQRTSVESILRNQLVGLLDPPVNQFNEGEGFGLGGYVVLDPAIRGQLGSVGQFGWSGAGSTSFTVDPKEQLLAILLLQHLPRGDAGRDLPRISREFYNLIYQSLQRKSYSENVSTVSHPSS